MNDDLFTVGLENKANVTQAINRKLTLKKVTISNFKNIEYKEYDLSNGKNLLLEGKNGLGKTNVLEAIYWTISGVLFDGTSKGDRQELKPKGSDNDVVVSVKLEFEHNGFLFERKMREKYTREGDFNGTETTLLVNGGVEKNLKNATVSLYDYLGINDIVNHFAKDPQLNTINIIELIYNANTLRTMDYKPLRALIIDMVGEVDFKEIINENKEKYQKLFVPIQSHGMDLEATKSATRNAIFDKEHGLNKRVDNLKSIVQEYDEKAKQTVDKEELEINKGLLNEVNDLIRETEDELKSDSEAIDKKYNGKISDLRYKILSRETEIEKENTSKINETKQKYDSDLKSKETSLSDLRNDRLSLNEKINDLNEKKATVGRTLTSKRDEETRLKEELTSLATKYKEIKSGDVDSKNDREMICPHCGTQFKESDLAEHKQHLAEQLGDINKRGQATSEKIQGLKEGIATLESDVEVIDNNILEQIKKREQLDKKMELLKADIETLKETITQETAKINVLSVDDDKTLNTLKEELKTITNEKNNALDNIEQHKVELNAKLTKLEAQKEEYQEIVNKENAIKQYKLDKKQAQEKLDDVLIRLQEKEDIVVLIKELEKDMYQKLDEKVVGVFGDNIRFQLYKLNVSNGEYDTRMCEMYVKDIHGTFVNIKRLNTGMFPIRATEFIAKIKAHYGIEKSFVFVDEVASLDNAHKGMLLAYGEQIFATAVSESNTVQEKEIK
jgi:DNA repair exonuclease SbcCD ATPase subunit